MDATLEPCKFHCLSSIANLTYNHLTHLNCTTLISQIKSIGVGKQEGGEGRWGGEAKLSHSPEDKWLYSDFIRVMK